MKNKSKIKEVIVKREIKSKIHNNHIIDIFIDKHIYEKEFID